MKTDIQLNRSWKKLLKSLKTFTAKPFVIFVYTIQEWIQWNLWKTPFKKLESYNLSKWIMSLQIFERLSSTKFTWSILGYFVSFFSYFEKKKFKFMFKKQSNWLLLISNYFTKRKSFYPSIFFKTWESAAISHSTFLEQILRNLQKKQMSCWQKQTSSA